ncbi:hypothetical protein CerSpe_107610 [Prunus speciosa]
MEGDSDEYSGDDGGYSGHGGYGGYGGYGGHGGYGGYGGHGGYGSYGGHGGQYIQEQEQEDEQYQQQPNQSWGQPQRGRPSRVPRVSAFVSPVSMIKSPTPTPTPTPGMKITNVSEYEAIAKKKLSKMIYDYYASGAEDQWTLKENQNAFSRILFRPRILTDVSNIDLGTTVLGFNISMPIMIAPTAMQKMAHPQGECATARAAAAANTIMTLSTLATSSVEEVASTVPGIRFFQLYVYKDRRVVTQLVKRAEKAGFKAIVLTVDTPRLGRREADTKNGFVLPPNLKLKNLEGLDLAKMDKTNDSGLASYVAEQIDPSLSWKDVKWLQTITKLPILLKGVLTAEDAGLAVQHGAAGIIVSNHGARQLDYVPATIMVLEEVVKVVQGRIPVFMDGGVRRGTDVFKALALGASGVFIGRPVLFALAADGEAGVRKVLQMLRDEFELTMSLSGCRSLKEISRDRIVTEWDHPRIASRL